MLTNHIRPHFGAHTKVADVAFADIDALHRKITKSGATYAANRCVAVLSKMFSLAIRWNMRETIRARGSRRNIEHAPAALLVWRRAGAAGEGAGRVPGPAGGRHRAAVAVDRREARRSAISMRWADVDLGEGVWSKPASSPSRRSTTRCRCRAPARQLLSEIRERQAGKHATRCGSTSFPAPATAGTSSRSRRRGGQLCRAAGITGLRIHDLRHSFASQLVSGGASLPLIGALLGHASPTTTARYAHLFMIRCARPPSASAPSSPPPESPPKEPTSLKPRRGA